MARHAMMRMWVTGTMLLLLTGGCTGDGRDRDDARRGLDPPARDLLAEGERVFADTCAPCHGAGGEGLEGRGPRLRDSAWVIGSVPALARIVLDGVRSDEAEEAGTYILPMAAWRLLPDRDLAAVLTFARRSWGHRAPPVRVEDVAAVRAATAGRTRPWSRDELHNLPDVLPDGQAAR